jgi:hypothetical protein
MGNLEWLDWVSIGLYFVLVFGVAIWATVRERTRTTSQDYFLASHVLGSVATCRPFPPHPGGDLWTIGTSDPNVDSRPGSWLVRTHRRTCSSYGYRGDPSDVVSGTNHAAYGCG